MRSQFHEWIPLDEAELGLLWDSGLVVIDTGALLGLYRMNEAGAQVALELFGWLGNRLWAPQHVGREFHERRLDVIRTQAGAYEAVRKNLQTIVSNMERDIARHAVLGSGQFLQELRRKVTELNLILDELEQQHPWPRGGPAEPDPIMQAVHALFDGKVGPPLEVTDAMRGDAQARLDAKVPPGFKDRRKAVDGITGDLLIWWQLLDRVREGGAAATGVLFVTEDLKEDWWWLVGGERLGPRPELAREALDAGAGLFWMQSLQSFIRSSAAHLGWKQPAFLVAEPVLDDDSPEPHRASPQAEPGAQSPPPNPR